MASALVDSTIVLRLMTAAIETAIGGGTGSGVEVQHLGEPEHKTGDVEARVSGFKIKRNVRNRSAGQPDDADFEATIEVIVGAISMEAAIDTITRASMAVVAAVNETDWVDAPTTHRVETGRADEEIATGAGTGDNENKIIGVSMITLTGLARRDSGSTIVALV